MLLEIKHKDGVREFHECLSVGVGKTGVEALTQRSTIKCEYKEKGAIEVKLNDKVIYKESKNELV